MVTWRSSNKAVILASEAHSRRYPDGGDAGVFDVEVEDLGTCGRDKDGLPDLSGRDLIDRMEW